MAVFNSIVLLTSSEFTTYQKIHEANHSVRGCLSVLQPLTIMII